MSSGDGRSGVLFMAAVVVLGGVLTSPTRGSPVQTAASDSTVGTAQSATLGTSAVSASTTLQEETEATLLAEVPETCPVTVADDDAFTPASETPDELSSGDDAVWFGTPGLWTKVQPNEQVRNRSWLRGEKTFWWSENFPGGGVEGSPNITVTAEHLDGLAPTVKSGGPGTNGFHPDLGDFMLVGVALPATGCWQLTADYKGATLRYVMWIPEV